MQGSEIDNGYLSLTQFNNAWNTVIVQKSMDKGVMVQHKKDNSDDEKLKSDKTYVLNCG